MNVTFPGPPATESMGAGPAGPDLDPEPTMKAPLLAPILTLPLASACASAQATPPAPVATRATSAAPFTVRVTGHGRPMILIPGLLSSGEVWEG